jgi:thiamine biosynthesis lipoprotein
LEASVVVTDPGVLAAAVAVVRAVLADVEQACSRFREDSELMRLQPLLADGALVSPLLLELVQCALDAARWTDGDVDPTLGADLSALGYDRDIVSVRLSPARTPEVPSPSAPRVPGWSRIAVDGRTLRVPADLRLDLGATAKAFAADRAASMVHSRLGCGVLVGLGGDLASAGPGPEGDPGDAPFSGRWQIQVQDLPADPSQRVSLEPGCAMATSSTQKRRWKLGGKDVHHILDPRIGLPAEPVWRSVTVAAPTCLEANAFSTAGIVRGFAAVEWFRSEGIPARLVDREGRTVTTGSWPKESCLIESGARHG